MNDASDVRETGVVIQLHADGPVSLDQSRLLKQVQHLRGQIQQMCDARLRAEIQLGAVVDTALDLMLLHWSLQQDPAPTDAEITAKRADLRNLLSHAALNATQERR